MPGQALNVMGVNDPKRIDMIKLQRRTRDVARRKQIVFDIQRYLAEQALFGSNGSTRVVSAWDAHIRNFMPNNGFDYGGRLMAVWIDKYARWPGRRRSHRRRRPVTSSGPTARRRERRRGTPGRVSAPWCGACR